MKAVKEMEINSLIDFYSTIPTGSMVSWLALETLQQQNLYIYVFYNIKYSAMSLASVKITQAWLGIWSMSHVFRCFMYTNSQLLGKYFYKYMPKMKKHIPFNVRPSYIIEITFTQEMRVIYNYIYCVLYIYAYYFTR